MFSIGTVKQLQALRISVKSVQCNLIFYFILFGIIPQYTYMYI
jgi:hypothetical protein